MSFVQSGSELLSTSRSWSPTWGYGGMVRLYEGLTQTYDQLYVAQPNVRTVVDFLGRNIAQLGIHVYDRVSDDERRRVNDHPLAELIRRPNRFTTRYRFVDSMVQDFAIHWNAYLLKVTVDGARELVRVPPAWVDVEGTALAPLHYDVTLPGAQTRRFKPEQVVHLRGYAPGDALRGVSPLETLRRILAEEEASGQHRETFWRNAGRQEVVVTRPTDAPKWSHEARTRFKGEFEALYAGVANAGRTVVLEEGMDLKAVSFSAKDAQYLEARKLTREEVASAFHIPPPMVGILDHATYSNVEQQHKQLYQDTLGPWLQMISQELELQLLPDLDDSPTVYVEFNLAEKLKGSFEEQSQQLQSSVGTPWLTVNEARSRMNLPPIDGGDRLVQPLNVIEGGQASPRDSAPGQASRSKARAKQLDDDVVDVRDEQVVEAERTLTAFFSRQRDVVLSRAGAKSTLTVDDIFDRQRWNRELAAELFVLSAGVAAAFGRTVFADYDPLERGEEWLDETSRVAAANINDALAMSIAEALDGGDVSGGLRDVFATATTTLAASYAVSRVTAVGNFGRVEAAIESGAGTKTWRTTSPNPRPEHAVLDGETVPVGQAFSNGARWPGDPVLGAEGVANCACIVEFS